jgi:hypothetical protein
MERARRILLVNFRPEDAQRLESIGLPADLGYIGTAQITNDDIYLPVSLPHPPYDYDIYIYNSEFGEVASHLQDNSVRDFGEDTEVLDGLQSYRTPPLIRISFLGTAAGLRNNLLGGAFSVPTTSAHQNVSGFEVLREHTFGITAVHEFIARLVPRIEVVNQYLEISDHHPSYGNPVLCNRQSNIVAGYGTCYTDRPHLQYVILPQFRDNTAVLLDLLRLIAKIEPEILPELSRNEWLESEKYAFSEEIAIEKQIQEMLNEVDAYVGTKRAEAVEVARNFGFIRAILTATENVEPSDKLSTNVKKVLEFLGFKVTDIDDKLKKAIKKEDFWVEDEAFFAIAEVSATINKNPKTKEYSDLLGRRSTIFQRRDLVPDVDPAIVSGLLVLNFDIETEPDQRPLIYSGGEKEFVGAARENSIGLLSTVDLYRIAIAVKDNKLSKENARLAIKGFGRIVYPPAPSKDAAGESTD